MQVTASGAVGSISYYEVASLEEKLGQRGSRCNVQGFQWVSLGRNAVANLEQQQNFLASAFHDGAFTEQ